MFKEDHLCCAGNLLDELYRLWIVFCFYLCVVEESGMLCRVAKELKSRGIKGVFIFLSPDVLDPDTANVFFPVLCAFPSDRVLVYDSVGRGAIFRRDRVC